MSEPDRCELCGGSDFVRNGDKYICNLCGTEYEEKEGPSIVLIELLKNHTNILSIISKQLKNEDDFNTKLLKDQIIESCNENLSNTVSLINKHFPDYKMDKNVIYKNNY